MTTTRDLTDATLRDRYPSLCWNEGDWYLALTACPDMITKLADRMETLVVHREERTGPGGNRNRDRRRHRRREASIDLT